MRNPQFYVSGKRSIGGPVFVQVPDIVVTLATDAPATDAPADIMRIVKLNTILQMFSWL